MPTDGKIEEFQRDGLACWQAIYATGGCTDCGCVDVGVGIMHHPDCGWDHAGDFDTESEAIKALSDMGATKISTVTIAQKERCGGVDIPF